MDFFYLLELNGHNYLCPGNSFIRMICLAHSWDEQSDLQYTMQVSPVGPIVYIWITGAFHSDEELSKLFL